MVTFNIDTIITMEHIFPSANQKSQNFLITDYGWFIQGLPRVQTNRQPEVSRSRPRESRSESSSSSSSSDSESESDERPFYSINKVFNIK